MADSLPSDRPEPLSLLVSELHPGWVIGSLCKNKHDAGGGHSIRNADGKCVECTRIRNKARPFRPDPPGRSARRREQKKARTKEAELRAWEKGLWQRYSLTISEYARLLARQDGHCGVCSATTGIPAVLADDAPARPLYVDHDHTTGQIRGLLCAACNSAIGNLGDNAEGVARALAYVLGIPLERLLAAVLPP